MTRRLAPVSLRRLSFRARSALKAHYVRAQTEQLATLRAQAQTAPLFGFQPVSDADMRLWIATMYQVDPAAPHARVYWSAAYDVAGKITRAKAGGHWPPTPVFVA